MFFTTPSTKEHTVQRIATTLVAVALIALALASVASAHRGARSHANVAPGPCAHHVRPTTHAASLRRGSHAARASHLRHRAAY